MKGYLLRFSENLKHQVFCFSISLENQIFAFPKVWKVKIINLINLGKSNDLCSSDFWVTWSFDFPDLWKVKYLISQMFGKSTIYDSSEIWKTDVLIFETFGKSDIWFSKCLENQIFDFPNPLENQILKLLGKQTTLALN